MATLLTILLTLIQLKKTTLYNPHTLLKISIHLMLETTRSDTELNSKEYSLHSDKGLTLKMSALTLSLPRSN